ncbi:L-aspartate oxidase [Marinoscillum sp. MHG1-6]|uniref:L-aspartate oxidase n=1 Tax=Marinoscillum sp. MHG1-6 TaxID=2959627 RepID=UPI002156FFB9|nr:L-aspartate oxidase [Marinoscillum sp. MHG1-6]
MEKERCDVLIVGTGIAGLSFALYLNDLRPDLSIILLSKGKLPETNTRLAQGGIAAVIDHTRDSFEQHKKDTLQAGGGYCDEAVVNMVVNEAPCLIDDLIHWGVKFDYEGSQFHLNREGGHSAFRILHHKDFTGREIHRRLLDQVKKRKNLIIKTNAFAVDLVIENNQVFGMDYCYSESREYSRILAKSVMLATGGTGQVFPFTTNDPCATGDGLAMASRAGAIIQGLQFYQFHPTALYSEGSNRSFLISEAVRGFGAQVLNKFNDRFLFKYDPRGELATRDIVSSAIYQEMIETVSPFVSLSVKHLDLNKFKAQFPTIWETCHKNGIDPGKEGIPVVPAAHYQCGGIQVDMDGQSTIERLYAGGECAHTGLHGSNRLASNSLLEALVFSRRSAHSVAKHIDGWDQKEIFGSPSIDFNSNTHKILKISAKKRALQLLMEHAWHHRNEPEQLEKALSKVWSWRKELAQHPFKINRTTGEFLNLIETSTLMLRALLEHCKMIKSASSILISN